MTVSYGSTQMSNCKRIRKYFSALLYFFLGLFSLEMFIYFFEEISDIGEFPKSQGKIQNSKLTSIFETTSSQEGKKSNSPSKSKAKNTVKSK